MTTLKDSIYLDAPVETVWEYLQDIRRRREWDIRVDRVVATSTQPLRTGSCVQYRFRGLGGTKFWMEGEYVKLQPCRRSIIRFRGLSKLCLVESAAGTWHCEPEGAGTRFRTTFHYELKLGRLGTYLDRRFTRSTLQKKTRLSLENLKRNLEQ